MDVELRMIKQQKSVEGPEGGGNTVVVAVADEAFERDIETANPRSMAFSHIETMINDRGGLSASVGCDNTSASKKIDMDIIDRLKSMRSKSRESSSMNVQSQ
jgi:hypothetical protein